jgi:hypothetical protein
MRDRDRSFLSLGEVLETSGWAFFYEAYDRLEGNELTWKDWRMNHVASL